MSNTVKPSYVYNALVTRVVDGDTYECLIDLGFECFTKQMIRLNGVNTPEIKGGSAKERIAGKRAAFAVSALLQSHGYRVTIRTEWERSFARYVADVWVGKVDLGVWIIENMLTAGLSMSEVKDDGTTKS